MQHSRYQRQQQVPQFGTESAGLLAAAKVLIVGVGGLVSPVASLLVRAGVCSVTLMDADTVEITNLHRQSLYTEQDVGKPKAEAALNRLKFVNSDVQIQALNEALSPNNAEELIRQHTVVVDAADNFFTSYLISDACWHHGVPMVSASVVQTSGHLGVFCGVDKAEQNKAPSYRAVFPSPALQTASCETVGVTGPSVGIVGAYQAQETLKVILGDPAQLLGRLLVLDLWRHSQHVVDFSNADEPKQIAPLIAESEIAADDFIVDVRSLQEVADTPRHHHINAPVAELADYYESLPKDQRLVCVCQSGHRALYAADQLFKSGFEQVAVAR